MRRAALVLTLIVTLAGCGGGSSSTGAAGNEKPTVFAASSLTEVFPQIEPNATYNFAGSDELATQIQEGAPADVYAAAKVFKSPRARERV